MPLRPRFEQIAMSFTIDGAAFAVTAWSDMTALEVVRLALGRDGMPSKCESGICGTCEVLVDGVPTRLCSAPARTVDRAEMIRATIITRPNAVINTEGTYTEGTNTERTAS